MAKAKALKKTEIRASLSELDELCKAEYGIELEQLLIDKTPIAAMRMQRLTGIVLKQRFATPSPPASDGATHARRAWPWKDGSPEESAAGAQRELKILNQLRMPGPWNEKKPLSGTSDDKIPITWEQFKDDVEHERGLVGRRDGSRLSQTKTERRPGQPCQRHTYQPSTAHHGGPHVVITITMVAVRVLSTFTTSCHWPTVSVSVLML